MINLAVIKHKYNGSESDKSTFSRVSRPSESPTNTVGYLRILLEWFNLEQLCWDMYRVGMGSYYEWSDPENAFSDSVEVRLRREAIRTKYNPNELIYLLNEGVISYMLGETGDCGFTTLWFEITYTHATNTLELKILRDRPK